MHATSNVKGLDDRIALIRNPVCHTIARVAYVVTACFCRAVYKAYQGVVAALSLLYRCVQIFLSIPSYVKNILFSKTPLPLKKSEKIELGLNKWLNRILKTPLGRSQKEEIHKAITGTLSPEETEALIKHILAEKKGPANERDCILFRAFLQKAKATITEESRVLLSPAEKFQNRQRLETETLHETAAKLKLIDPARIQGYVADTSEAIYLLGRSNFIRATVNIDPVHLLWDKCCNEALSIDEFCDLQTTIANFQQRHMFSSKRETRSNRLLKIEYCLLLKQRLALSSDTAKWNRGRAQIEDFNATVKGCIESFHTALCERWTKTHALMKSHLPFPLPKSLDLANLGAKEIGTYFQQAQEVLQTLHTQERVYLQRPDSQIDVYLSQTGGLSLQEMQKHISATIDVPARQDLLSIRDSQKRKEERHKAIAEQLFYACLEKTPDGQQLFRLMHLTPLSEEDRQIKEASQNAFKALYARNARILLNEVLSAPEYVANIGGAEFPSLQQVQRHDPERDFSSVQNKLDLQMGAWHKKLQEIWMNHLSFDQEKEIATFSGAKRMKKMAQCFSDWMLKKTGIPFSRVLPFHHCILPNEQKERLAALETIKRNKRAGAPKVSAAASSAPLLSSKTFRGAPLDWIDLPSPASAAPLLEVEPLPFDQAGAVLLNEQTDLIDLVKKLPPYNPQAALEERIAWTESACENPIYLIGLKNGFLSLYAAFYDIAHSITKPVELSFLYQFLDLVRDQNPCPLQKDNSWRKGVLTTYLKMLLEGRGGGNPIEVDEEQRKYLVQAATLAEFQLPKFTIVPKGCGLIQCGVSDIGQLLQNTEIGLEGLEESTLQLSFQTSNLPQTPEIRTLIDALRTRNGQELPISLLSDVLKAYRWDHYQGQQAISRAIAYAFRGAPAEHITYLESLLAPYEQGSSKIDPTKMIMPPRISILDCILTLKHDHPTYAAEVEAFDNSLIESKNAAPMLMGYARKIVYLSSLFEKDASAQNFAELLKYKIAYQALKTKHFDGKVALHGFLKCAVDRAEFAMTHSLHLLSTVAPSFAPDIIVTLLHQTQSPDPALKSNAEKAVEKVFKRQQQNNLPLTWDPPFFLSFGKTDLDIVSGYVYFDGQERLELPPEFQNHPHVRALDLQNLPYVRNPDGSFSHSTVEAGRKVPQVRIAMNAQKNLIIQRRLPTSFTAPEEICQLQYLPLEHFKELPTAIAQRMGVEEFWIGPDATVYGYSKKGKLILSLTPSAQVTTTAGTFVFPDQVDLEGSPGQAVLQHLLHALPLDEILVNQNGTAFWIPSLNLTISLGIKGVWNCTSPTISGMVLDLAQPPRSSVLVLKRQERNKDAIRKTENELILLRKHLGEAEAEKSSSLHTKGEIAELKKMIADTEVKLTQLDPHLYIALLPEQIDSLSLRESLNKEVSALITLSQEIVDPDAQAWSKELQKKYLSGEKRYHTLQEKYDTHCRTDRRVVYLETLVPENVTGRDLSGVLFLVIQALKEGKNLDAELWVQEFAKHPFQQPLSQRSLDMLKEAAYCSYPRRDALSLYLHLLLCQNTFFVSQEIAKALTPDQDKRLQSAQAYYKEMLAYSSEVYSEMADKGEDLPVEVKALLHTHCPGTLRFNPPTFHAVAPYPLFAARKLQGLASQSLLERLSLTESVIPTPKDPSREIPESQKRLIKAFKNHSPDQVVGFYLEEFGMFSAKSLYREFCLYDDTLLFGLTEADTKTLFDSLIAKGWIEQRTPTDFYYAVTVKGSNPLGLVQTEDLLALVAHLPISPEDRKRVVDTLRVFFFKAVHASFSFSWKDVTSLKVADTKLAEEQEQHRTEMLDAEFFLQERLGEAGISLTEFKRKVITNDRTPLPFREDEAPPGEDVIARADRQLTNYSAARNALIRYLFHKTELQHITNVMKAASKGERNKIELLSTARQYPVDLLFQELPPHAPERENQIIQLAFLLFEENYGARCNAMQVKLFRSLMLDAHNEDAIDAMQARMGFGKTALLPLMALVQIAKEAHLPPEEKSLVRYVVPTPVLEDNAAAFQERISLILGSHVLKDREFPRYQIDPNNKLKSFERILNDLETRLAFYDNARKQGLVLIQRPEIRQSMEAQKLAFGFLLLSGRLSEQESVFCLRCKQMLGRIRSIQTYTPFDELDATQDFKACEVNFTEGKKLPIDPHTIRPLAQLIACVAQHYGEPLKDLARSMFQSLNLPLNALLLAYVTDRNYVMTRDVEELLEELKAQEPAHYSGVFLVRAILLDPNMLAFVYNKQPNTHFGVSFTEVMGKKVYLPDPESGSPLLIAVPYEGTNTPKGLSTFDNTEVAAIATLRYYESRETLIEKDPHLDFLVKQTQKNAIPDFLGRIVDNVRNREGKSFIERLRHLSGLLDSAEIEQGKQKFYEDFLKNPSSAVRSYLGMAVVAVQVRTDEARANSNRYEMGSPKDRIKGCSGTISSTSSYFERPANDPAADGKLSLEIMGRENNAPIAVLAPFGEGDEDYLGHVLDSLLAVAKGETRAIMDVAGICKSRDGRPETIVAALWTLLQNHTQITGIEGIVYYGKDNVKRLYRGPHQPPIPCTTAMELAALPQKKYFSFYGQKNTRGSDIKQADGAHALVTMDENVTNNEAKQGVLRFRSLVQRSSGQTFTFALTAGFAQMLQNKKKAGSPPIDAKDVVKDLRIKELAQEQHDALVLFRKELHAHVKQAAAYAEHQIFSDLDLSDASFRKAYIAFLKERDVIIPMVERALHDLMLKYGGSLRSQDRDLFIQQEIALFQEKLRCLEALSGKTISVVKPGKVVELDFPYYYKRITSSKVLFETRYPKDLPVEVSAVDSGAEAVAIALAQAQAEAQAEALAERINENIVQVQGRLPDLKLSMTKEPHFSTKKDWFKNPTGTPIAQFEEIKHLIHPDMREITQLSPHMAKQRLVSHFALVPKEADKPHLFVSQEEADTWLQLPPAERTSHDLIDLRRQDLLPPLRTPLLIKMQNAMLQHNEAIAPIAKTEDLRKLTLENVTSRQLLPTLSVEGVADAELSDWIDLKSFGIHREGKIPLSLQRQEDGMLRIQAGNSTVQIPTQNQWLQPIFKEVYVSPTPGKFLRVKAELEKASANFRQQLEALHRQEQALKEQEHQLSELVQNASTFEITGTLKDGLLVRDGEFANRSDVVLRNCGQAFLDKMKEIEAAQRALIQNPSQANLNHLDRLFKTFLSDKMLQFKGTEDTPVFDHSYWESHLYRGNGSAPASAAIQAVLVEDGHPPFDLVYGRILYSVHGGQIGGINGAKGCGRLDCKQMFNVTLPAMQKAIANIRRAIRELPAIQEQIQKIKKAIEVLAAKANSLKEADACIAAMGTQSLTKACSAFGIVLEDQPHQFWDRFHFETLHSWPTKRIQATLEGELPLYHQTILGRGEYQHRIHALSKEEGNRMIGYGQLHHAALKLAARVEPRENEVRFSV